MGGSAGEVISSLCLASQPFPVLFLHQAWASLELKEAALKGLKDEYDRRLATEMHEFKVRTSCVTFLRTGTRIHGDGIDRQLLT